MTLIFINDVRGKAFHAEGFGFFFCSDFGEFFFAYVSDDFFYGDSFS